MPPGPNYENRERAPDDRLMIRAAQIKVKNKPVSGELPVLLQYSSQRLNPNARRISNLYYFGTNFVDAALLEIERLAGNRNENGRE